MVNLQNTLRMLCNRHGYQDFPDSRRGAKDEPNLGVMQSS